MGVFRRKVRGKRSDNYTAKFAYGGRLYRRGGFPDRQSAQHWIDSTRISLRRGEVGFVKTRSAAKVQPLVDEFASHLAALRRSTKYSEVTQLRLSRLAEEAPWITLADFTAASFEDWRASRPTFKKKPLGPKTLNQFLDHATIFGDWLVKSKRLLPQNPMTTVARMTAKTNNTYRRAATPDELNRLLASAPSERAVIYRFLIYVPLRRRAMEGIEWRDLALDGERPTLTLRAELSKTGRAAKLPIRRDLAEVLAAYRGDADDDDRVFRDVPRIRVMQKDLEAAGIPFADERGQRRLDLHAFRKTVIRLLKQAGVPLDEAHVFLQHRDRRTTERYYDDDLVAPEISTAAERMPSFGLGAYSGAHIQDTAEKAEK